MTPVTTVDLRLPLRAALGGSRWRRVTLVEGPCGWGEFSPLPGYPCEPGAARAAAEEAAFVGWPSAVRREVAVNALVPAVGPAEAAAIAAGASDVKVKVGGGDIGGEAGGALGVDVDRVAAVRNAVGPAGRIRVDANGAWDVEQAVAAIGALARYGVDLVEQPVPTLAGLAEVRRRVAVPVAADECVRGVDDARELARLGAADAVVLKVQPLGGVASAMAVAEAAGVPAIVTSMYESSVGLAAGLALAAALPELPWACGLGTASLFAADVVTEPLLAVDGMLTVRRPVPDPALLARYSVAG